VKANDKIPTLYGRGRNTPDRRVLDSITREFSWRVSDGGPKQEDWEILLGR